MKTPRRRDSSDTQIDSSEVKAYIETVDKTLRTVFHVPDERRTELIAYLKKETQQGLLGSYSPLFAALFRCKLG